MNSVPITYSSYVVLNLSAFPNVALYSDGFTTQCFSLRSFHELQGDLFQDYQNCVFRILPVLNYRAHDSLLEQLTQDDFEQLQNEGNLKKRKQLIQSLQQNLENELSSNISLTNKLAGTPLVFSSSTFHLVHMSSLKFLALDDENLEDLQFKLIDFPNDNTVLKFNPCLNFQKLRTNVVYESDVVCVSAAKQVCNRTANLYTNYWGDFYYQVKEDRDRYLAEIRDAQVLASVEEQTQFRISIFQTQSSNEDTLFVGDVVIINLPEQNKFLNGRRTRDLFDKVQAMLDGNPIDQNFSDMKPLFQKQTTLFPPSALVVPLSYSRQMSDGDMMKPDSNLKLSSSIEKQKSIPGSRQSVFIKGSNDVQEIERLLMSELNLQFDTCSPLPYSAYWRVESEDKAGGECGWEKCYRLRHFQTGKYLEITQTGKQLETTQMKTVRLTNEVLESTLFKFISVQKGKQTKFVTKETYFHICDKDAKWYIDQQGGTLVAIPEHRNENVFKIRKADYEDVWEKRFLLFFIPLLTQALSYFEVCKQSNITSMRIEDIKERLHFYQLFHRLSQMLNVMDQFVHNRLISNIQTEQDYSFVSKSRQDIIREESVMPLLIWLLIRAYPSSQEMMEKSKDELISDLAGERAFIYRIEAQVGQQILSSAQVQKLEDNHKKRKLLLSMKLFQTLKSICHNNAVNQEIFVTRFFSHYQKNLAQDYVCETLISCVQRNYHILSQLGKQSKLQSIINLLMDHQSPELLEILASACQANEEPIFQNQEFLLRTLIQDERISSKVLIPLSVQQSGDYYELYVEYKDSEGSIVKAQLKDFLEDREINPNFYHQYRYLIQQLSLKANLCFHRNTQAREILSMKFNYQLLLTYALDEGIDDGIRAQICKMIRTMYIDREPFTTTPKPELVRILEPIETQDPMFLYEEITFEREGEQTYNLKSLKTKLLSYIQLVYNYLKECRHTDKVYNLLTLEVIKILELLLKYQLFWQPDSPALAKKNSRKKTYIPNNDKVNFNEENREEEIDRLIAYLALMLEYDHSYFKCLQEYKVQRAYMSGYAESIGVLNFKTFGSVFQMNETQKQAKPTRTVKVQDSEVVNDPLFKKMKSLRKVIQKYTNKTFTLRENKEDDYETLIKIQICQVFSYLMDVSQDYWIDNALTHFKTSTEHQFAQLFPHNILSAGEKFQNYSKIYYTQPPSLRSFDEVLRRPFIEVLLIAMYFTRNPQLENQIVELIQRFARQKKEFCQHFSNVQILELSEQQQLYNVWILIVNNLKNNVQRSQTWMTRESGLMEETLQDLWKIDSIFQQSESVSLKLKQQIFQHIGGYSVLLELVDKGIVIIDQIDKEAPHQKLNRVLNFALSIMGQFTKDNEQNQLMIYKRVAKKILPYTDFNIGQVNLITSLFSGKPTLFGQLGPDEYGLFVVLIQKHGQYPEFLSFYEEILKVTEQYSKDNSEMHALVLEYLTNPDTYQYLDPFAKRECSEFYEYQPNYERYKMIFLRLLSRCLDRVSNASLVNQVISKLDLQEMLNYTLKISNYNLQSIIQREKPDINEIRKYVWNLIRNMIENSNDAVDSLLSKDACFFQILKIELQAITLQEHFDSQSLDYLFDSLMPIVNKYNEMLQNALMSSAQKEEKMFEFVDFFLRNLDRMFFLAPQELLGNAKRMQTITELALSFNIELKDHLKFTGNDTKSKELDIPFNTQKSIQQENSRIRQFRNEFMANEEVKKMLKAESSYLSNSIWTIQKMFSDEGRSDTKDLLLTNQDIIVKILAYLQFWKSNGASRDNVIFILKVLSAILKDAEDEEDELTDRQNLFDRMNAPQIIIVLLCESDFEPEYICTLMRFMILLLRNGNSNVQKTIYEFFLSNSQCELLFKQFKRIMNMQISSHDSAHKLNAIENKLVCKSLKVMQLLCEGHNQDLQNYLRNQHNQKNSQDLVTHTVALLKSFTISTQNYDSVLQCLETLTEMVQGPCKLNQQALIKANLVEIVVQVLDENEKMFEVSSEFKRKDIPYRLNLHPGNLARLKFKCLNTLVSLLECSEPQDNEIMRIVRAIPLNVLTNNITRIFKLFKEYADQTYKDELFNRIEVDITDEHPPDYFELIIENGFHIYLLMQLFLGNQKAKELLYEDSEMNEVLNEFNIETSSDSNPIVGIFQGIGMMAKFGGQLFAKGFELINQQILQTPEQQEIERKLKEKKELKELTKEAVKFFRKNTCSIDMIREDRIYTIYFPRLPICNLPKDAKIDFHDSVDRTSSKTKLTTLIDSSPYLIKIMKYEEKLNQLFAINPVFGFFATHGKLWESCAFATTLIINIIVLISYTQDLSIPGKSIRDIRLFEPRLLHNEAFEFTPQLIQILGILMLAFSSLIVFFFLVKRAPLKVDEIWNNYKLPSGCFKITVDLSLRSIKSIFILLQDLDILYYSIYIIAGIVGLAVHPFFFAFHLMGFLKLEQLKTVIQAIWNPRKEMGLALLLLTIMEYYIGILSYVFFYNDYPIVNVRSCHELGSIIVCERACSTLWQCMVTSFDLTFKANGSIGALIHDFDTISRIASEADWAADKPYSRVKYGIDEFNGVDHQFQVNFFTRFVFDHCVNIFLVMILLNMIQGIIIDTFGSLREQQQERIRDQTMKCYICGITREKFEKNDGGGFGEHIAYEHYMWNYVYFYAYLMHKDENDFNGNESYIKEKIDLKDISWLPIKRARFADEENDDSKQVKEMQEKACEQMKQLREKLQKLQLRMAHIIELSKQNSIMQTIHKK